MLTDRYPVISTASTGDRRYVSIAQALLESIMRGDYPVGARLPTDREMAVTHGVSRPTVREALLVLELVGVVEASAGAGVYVRSPTPKLRPNEKLLLEAPADLIEARLHIEPVIAVLCAERIQPAGLRQLSDLVDQAEEAASADEPFPRFSDLSLEFHAALADHCGNQILRGIARQLVAVNEHPLWVLLNQSVLRTREDRLAQVAEHRAVLEAIRSHDGRAASQAMAHHLDELSLLIVRRPTSSPAAVVA